MIRRHFPHPIPISIPMKTESSTPTHAVIHDFRSHADRFPFLNWSAIFGGTVLAMAVH